MPDVTRLSHRITRTQLRLGYGLPMLLALSACTTVTVQPAAENSTLVNGAPINHAPVVESSMYSDGAPVAAPVPPPSSTSIEPSNSAPSGGTILSGSLLQAGTFSNQTNAEKVAASIRDKAPQFSQMVHVRPRGNNWRVLIGPFATDTERMHATDIIRNAIGSDVVNAAP